MSAKCYHLLMMSMNLSNISILHIKGSDYCCIVSLISKVESISLKQNAKLTQNIVKHKKLLSPIKMGKIILTFRNTKNEKINFTTIRILFL